MSEQKKNEETPESQKPPCPRTDNKKKSGENVINDNQRQSTPQHLFNYQGNERSELKETYKHFSNDGERHEESFFARLKRNGIDGLDDLERHPAVREEVEIEKECLGAVGGMVNNTAQMFKQDCQVQDSYSGVTTNADTAMQLMQSNGQKYFVHDSRARVRQNYKNRYSRTTEHCAALEETEDMGVVGCTGGSFLKTLRKRTGKYNVRGNRANMGERATQEETIQIQHFAFGTASRENNVSFPVTADEKVNDNVEQANGLHELNGNPVHPILQPESLPALQPPENGSLSILRQLMNRNDHQEIYDDPRDHMDEDTENFIDISHGNRSVRNIRSNVPSVRRNVNVWNLPGRYMDNFLDLVAERMDRHRAPVIDLNEQESTQATSDPYSIGSDSEEFEYALQEMKEKCRIILRKNSEDYGIPFLEEKQIEGLVTLFGDLCRQAYGFRNGWTVKL